MITSIDALHVTVDTVESFLFVTTGPAGKALTPEGGINLVHRAITAPPDWFFVYILVLFGLFAWIRNYYGSIFIQTFEASINFQVTARMFKDNSVLQKQLDNFLYGFYFLSTALLLVVAERKTEIFPYHLQGMGLYLFNLGLLIGTFLFRIVLVNISGFIFNRINIFREYLYNTFIFNKLTGIIILPLLLLMVYTKGHLQDVFHWITLITVVLILGMRITRGIIFTFKKGVLLFYLFLYLCALEIVPLALLYKWLQGIL
ncbi:MAG TPA: DUF4271 domain-containing protein [Bacteroidales bacterium]|nr:DUF4271 domain-containing protein [Bacteroidales bacterium]